VFGGLSAEDDDESRASGVGSRIVHVPKIQVGRGWGATTTIVGVWLLQVTPRPTHDS
jgi:hypothetical protein